MSDLAMYNAKSKVEGIVETVIYDHGTTKKVILTMGVSYSVFVFKYNQAGEVLECGHVKSGQYI